MQHSRGTKESDSKDESREEVEEEGWGATITERDLCPWDTVAFAATQHHKAAEDTSTRQPN